MTYVIALSQLGHLQLQFDQLALELGHLLRLLVQCLMKSPKLGLEGRTLLNHRCQQNVSRLK